MKRPLGIAIAVLLTTASGTASADGPYASMAVGAGAHLDGDLGALLDAYGHLSGRFTLGVRIEGWAVEAALTAIEADSLTLEGHHQMVALHGSLARYFQLAERWELLARVGAGRAGIGSPEETVLSGYDGFALESTVGVQYRKPIADAGETTGNFGVSLELTRQSTWMEHPSAKPIRGGATYALVGVSLGF